MKRLSNKKITVATVALIATTGFFSPVWNIQDPVRDANWILKQIKEGIMHTERLAHKATLREQDLSESLWRNKTNEKHSSAKIRAKTTATSNTANLASEERYSTGKMIAKHVCEYIKGGKSKKTQNDCAQEKSETITLIEKSLKQESAQQATLAERITVHKHQSNQPTDERKTIESYGNIISETSRLMTQYTLLTPEQKADIEAAADLLFFKKTKTPSVTDILKTNTADANQFEDLQRSLLLRQLFLDGHSKRVVDAQKGSTAENQTIIESGTPKRYQERLEQIGKADSSHEVTRQLALMKANRLLSQYERLLKNHQHVVLLALTLKGNKGETR